MRQEYPPEKDTKRFAPATLRRRLHEFYFGGSLFVVLRAANRTGSSRPGDDCLERTEAERRTRSIVQDASKRSNGLSRNRVPSSGEYSCLRVPTLPNSNHRKRPNDTTGNSCIRITGKNLMPPPLPPGNPDAIPRSQNKKRLPRETPKAGGS